MLNIINNIEQNCMLRFLYFELLRIDIDGQHKEPYIESLKGLISKKSCWRKYFSKEQFETLNVVFIYLL